MKRTVLVFLGVLLVGLAALFLFDQTTPTSVKPLIAARFPEVQWVETRTLSQWLERPRDARPRLLDVRTSQEYAVSHLEGALRLDPAQPDIDALKLAPDETVVVYCAVGYRSAAIVDRLEEAGTLEIFNLEGGLFAWANEGRPVYRDGKRVEQVHPYDRIWGRLLRPELRAPLIRD